ncbi:MAG: family 43 glycosylhydrolase [Cellulosilyticaceae bacterium]
MKKMVNPILPLDEFIPDVEARIFSGSDGVERLFLYGSHDEYNYGTWCSYQYRVYSAPLTNLTDWTDHGVSFASRKGEGYIWEGEEISGIDWTEAMLYAPDVLEIEDKYWLASCLSGGGLGISVSDKPEGPFSPATRIVYDTNQEPLGSIDPTLYAEDGRVYLIWGQRQSFGAEGLVGVELEKDNNGMYAIAKQATKRYLFGDEENPDKGFGFYEGPSIRKIGEKYYILYPSDKGKGVHMMSYATADEPLGNYTFRGNILDNDGCDLEGGNNHGSLCEVNGQWYIFYHRGFGNSNMRRKVCVEAIQIEEDGSILPVEMTNHGFGGAVSPYERVEAAYATHVRLDQGKSGCYFAEYDQALHPLIQITDGNCVEYKDFEFGIEPREVKFVVEVNALGGGEIELILDHPESEVVGTIEIEPSDEKMEWKKIITSIQPICGIHTLFLKFNSDHLENICELAAFWFEKIDK